MRIPRDCTCQGIILRKTKYQNSSLLLEILSKQYGKISVLAKGIRNEKSNYGNLMEIGNELDWQLSKTQTDLFYFKQAVLQNAFFHSLTYEQSLPLYAAIELYLQLVIASEESERFYHLLSTYFRYIATVQVNRIVIFWRFVLRLFRMYGIPIDLEKCCNCQSNLTTFYAFSSIESGFYCENCYQQEKKLIIFNKADSNILHRLPKIGNFLSELTVPEQTVQIINSLLLQHLEEHFHKTFHLRSLQTTS